MTAREPLLSRKVVGIAAKLYEAQDTAKRLYGARYEEMVEPWRQAVRALATEKGENEVSAAKIFLELLQARPGDTSASQMLVMAATVDLVEPEGDTTP